jgi:hypothetical protein
MRVSRRDFLLATMGATLATACTPITESVCCQTPLPSCPAPAPLPIDLPAARCELFAFDEIHRAMPTVYKPKDSAELAAVLRSVPEGRHLSIRGGGQSLDGQSLNEDLVVLLESEHFGVICDPKPDKDGSFYLTAGAGARWWDVLAKVAPYGLVPRSLVTAGQATVGGTLSADCVSRQSPIAGKEGEQIRGFTVVLVDGRTLELTRNDRRLPADDERRQLWESVIGGFGYLGVVTSVTFDLMVARSNPGGKGGIPRVLTRATRHGANVDWDEVLRSLYDKTQNARARYRGEAKSGDPLALTPEWAAISIASFLEGAGMSANLLEQRFVEDLPLRPVPGGVYTATASFPAVAEALIPIWPSIVELGLEMGFPEGEFVDELFGWAFFLGNSTALAKKSLHRQGKRLNFVQQSFALPSDARPGSPDTGPTRRFIELAQARLHAADVRPADIDFLWIPADRFLLSANRDLPGYVVTLSFADTDRTELSPEVDGLLRALSHDCRTLGGRVHLVKNVVADQSDLLAMHGDAARELRQRKKRFDPRNILRNAFFHRVFEA